MPLLLFTLWVHSCLCFLLRDSLVDCSLNPVAFSLIVAFELKVPPITEGKDSTQKAVRSRIRWLLCFSALPLFAFEVKSGDHIQLPLTDAAGLTDPSYLENGQLWYFCRTETKGHFDIMVEGVEAKETVNVQFNGMPGSGKSTIAFAACLTLAKQKKSVRWLHSDSNELPWVGIDFTDGKRSSKFDVAPKDLETAIRNFTGDILFLDGIVSDNRPSISVWAHLWQQEHYTTRRFILVSSNG